MIKAIVIEMFLFKSWNLHYTEYLNTGGFKFIPDTKVFEDIDSANKVVYKSKLVNNDKQESKDL